MDYGEFLFQMINYVTIPVFQSTLIFYRLPSELESWMKKNVNIFTVNGEVRPVISLAKNEVYRFRYDAFHRKLTLSRLFFYRGLLMEDTFAKTECVYIVV